MLFFEPTHRNLSGEKKKIDQKMQKLLLTSFSCITGDLTGAFVFTEPA